jgi:hypothetical protein
LVFSECRSRGSGARGQNTKIGSVV